MKLDLNQKEDYKETELGLLPNEWGVVRLGEEIEEVKEKNKINAKYPVFTVSNIYGLILSDNFFDKQVYSKKLDTYKIIHSNSFVYNPYRINVGSIGLFNGEIGLVSPAYVVFKIKNYDRLNPKFLYNLIKSPFYLSEIERISFSRGSVRRSLSFKDLSNFKIPLPPLSEQKKIAYVLSAVQEAKEKAEDVIKATKELKKSMMKHLFTYGPVSLEEAEKVPLKETEIGLVPEGWKVVKLGDLFKNKNIIIQFGFPCGKWNDKGLGVPHLRPFNVSNDGQVVLNGLKFINIERDINRYLLKKGDILFNNTNSEELVGKTAYWNKDGDFVLSNHMTIIRVLNFDLINSQFLANYLHKKWYDGFYLKICRRHVNQASISLARLEQIQIPLPPLSEQKKIASILSAIDQKIEAEESKKKAVEDLFKSLLYNLMTAKIRVNHLENVFDE